MITINDLTVERPDFKLGPINLRIQEPITAIIGPNGSGKTTLIDALIGEDRTSGKIAWNGMEIGDVGRRERIFKDVSYVPDEFPELFLELRPVELWTFIGSVRQQAFGTSMEKTLEQAFVLAERLALNPGSKRHKHLSLGMKRKSQLICGLMSRPSLLIVDEPQNGLDFVSSASLRDVLLELVQREGAQVLMSNHDLDSVARVAHRVIVLRDGECVRNIDSTAMTGAALEECMRDAFGGIDEP